MSRANNNGWDFIKVGKTYQYKEDSFIALAKILEDNSTETTYVFKVQIEKANFKPPHEEFVVSHTKKLNGFWMGMLQFYQKPEYYVNYIWEKGKMS